MGRALALVDLYDFGPGHTNGDAFILFRALRTMHSGDAFSGPIGGSGVRRM